MARAWSRLCCGCVDAPPVVTSDTATYAAAAAEAPILLQLPKQMPNLPLLLHLPLLPLLLLLLLLNQLGG